MTNETMYEMHKNGFSYQKIADVYSISRQAVHQRITSYKRKVLGIRGQSFDINKIVYKGIYDWFCTHYNENVYSLAKKLYKDNPSSRTQNFKRFLVGENNSHFSIPQMKLLCEIIGKPFEEVFERRKTE